jgi:hypothetical protein
MNAIRRWLPLAALLFTLLPEKSHAAGVRLGLGADYWARGYAHGLFSLTLAVDAPLARSISIGGRFGAMVSSGPSTVGVPIDLVLRAIVGGRVYLEGLVGPWIIFRNVDPLVAHAAFGFGLRARDFTFGLEVGYAHPSPLIGLRLGFVI